MNSSQKKPEHDEILESWTKLNKALPTGTPIPRDHLGERRHYAWVFSESENITECFSTVKNRLGKDSASAYHQNEGIGPEITVKGERFLDRTLPFTHKNFELRFLPEVEKFKNSVARSLKRREPITPSLISLENTANNLLKNRKFFLDVFGGEWPMFLLQGHIWTEVKGSSYFSLIDVFENETIEIV